MPLPKYFLLVVVAVAMACLPTMGQQSSAQSSTAVPRLMNFSGHATDAHGGAVSGVLGVTIAIYKDQHEGIPLWIETQNVAADKTGHYSAQLGATKTEGLPLELFSSGEARWLGVRVNGGEEQPRVLLLSVPYALKAADSETLGGFPASAFMLAASANMGSTGATALANADADNSLPPTGTLTGAGTVNYVPLWTGSTSLGNSALFQTGTGTGTRIGINTNTPSSTLDVKGAATFRGAINMAATGLATPSTGKVSQSQNFTASAYDNTTATAVSQTFHWRAEPVGNNANNIGGSLNLLFAQGTTTPTETGLAIASNGRIIFAPGQTFPGSGTVTNVGLSAPASDFTVSGSPVTNSGTFTLSWNVAPTSSNTANAIVKRDGAGNIQTNGIGVNKLVASSIAATTSSNLTNTSAVVGGASATGSGMTYGVTGFSSTDQGAGVYGNNNNSSGGYGVVGKAPNGAGVHGSGAWGFDTDSNVHQSAPFGGWVKAMLLVDGRHGGPYILRCFNSALSGAAATTVPCGFKAFHYEIYTGRYDIEIGYDISHNFVSALGVEPGSAASGALTVDCDCDANDINTDVMVNLYSTSSGDFEDGKFYVVIY